MSKSNSSNIFVVNKQSCKVITGCRQFLRSDHVLNVVWPWSTSKANLKVQEGHRQTLLRFWCEEHLCKVRMHFLRSYCINKAASAWTSSQLDIWCSRGISRWPSASLKDPKSQTKVSIKLIIWDLDVENLPVQLQHNAGYSWRVITLTRLANLGLTRKFKKVRQCQFGTLLRFYYGEHLCKVTAS